MRFLVTVRKLNVTKGQTDGGGGGVFQYLPFPAFGTAGDKYSKKSENFVLIA